MSEKQKKINLFKKNVLSRHEWDDIEGNKLINDFLQVSKMAEDLKESNFKAYTMFMSLVQDKIKLQEECDERGKRISRLQKK
ncbi:hypothetical protein [uncultured Trichococcus sp.]|jgi:hypothetical protein|uniref:hypothetical protein n=1 Tax=uncultured Trichococcus sp. TaxID=189665 RepID=UPI0029C040D6|nr:hypothetical protein [uncultured Trichococcus sp.]